MFASSVGERLDILSFASHVGLEFDHAAGKIGLINPTVPSFVGDITIRNLHLGNATADFAVRQDGGAISLQVLRATAGLQVSLVFDHST